ncbi:formate dehydrogenase subunit gamma [Marinobacter alexandrii]|uniref:formate dehydrogenase subunit gamma n=1 Tax=Marinobacter alexandrii TaxID=2570351 RepID=UPI00329A4685
MQQDQVVTACIERYRSTAGGLLPLLHDLQAHLGYIPSESVSEIASALNLSRAEVHGVITFYHDFRTEKGGRHRVQICCAEACQAMGAQKLQAHAMHALGVAMGETSADGRVTLEPVYCLGNCACSPSVRIDEEVHARVDARRFDQLLNALDDEGKA